jgi:iron complex outermembrane receptor protein
LPNTDVASPASRAGTTKQDDATAARSADRIPIGRRTVLIRQPRLLLGSATIALAAMAAVPTFAAEDAATTTAAPAEPGEIIVTAQRRAERVTKVPISITVADSAQLERQQVNTVNDLNRIAPSLEIQSAPGQNTGGGGSIRGIGTQTFSAGAVASVGVVVDQVSQGNANISDLFDVARVEVLKGPQGTLFGLTTSAGVINITTNRPEFDTYSVRLRTELSGAGKAGSEFGDQVVQGVVNIPIAGNAALRVAGFTNLRQGPDYDTTTGKYDNVDTWGLRAHLRWEPTSQLSVNLIGDYSRTRVTNGGDFFTFVQTSGQGFAAIAPGFAVPDNMTANLATCGVTAGVGNRNYCTSQYYTDHNYTGGASLNLEYQAEPFTITSITAYRHSLESGSGAATNVLRADPSLLEIINAPVHRPIDLATQELRLSSPAGGTVEYTAGVFGSTQVSHRDAEPLTVFAQVGPQFYIDVHDGGAGESRVRDSSAAVFGQATIRATEKLRLIVGGRYTRDWLKLNTLADAIPGSTTSQTELNVSKFSWKLGAQYDVARRTMAYATVTRGFKGGQIAQPADANPYVVLPEVPTSYELGLKSTLFGGWVLDTDLFYETIRNFQAQQCTVDVNNVISCVQQNIDGVKSRGAEINLFGKVTRNLSLNTGFIFAKATYPTGFIGTDGSNIGGTQLAYAPKYKFTLSGEYTKAVASGINGFIAVDTVWKSRLRYEQNTLAATTFQPHWNVGGRLGLRTADDRYSLAVFARNLFNSHEPSLMQSSLPYALTNGQQNIGAIYGPQSFRQVGLSLDARF